MPNRPELAEVLDLLLDAVCVVDAAGCFVYVSAAAEQIFGYRPEEMIGRPMIGFVAPEDRERTQSAAAQVMGGEPLPSFENHYLHRLGHRVPVMWSARWSAEHGMRIAVAHDVSEKRRAERLQHALFALSEAAHETGDVASLLCRTHTILDRMLPADRCAIVLRDPQTLALRTAYRSDNGQPVAEAAPELLGGHVIERGEALLCHPGDPRLEDGSECSWIGVPLHDEHSVIGCLSLMREQASVRFTATDLELLHHVSRQIAAAIERKQLQARLERMAHHDTLTGLPNRGLLLDRLEVALARARRHAHLLGLLFVDLDDFKRINDEQGHAAGDALLCEVARRLQASVRACDTVSRIGGDEFVVLIEDLVEESHAHQVGETLRTRLEQGLPEDVALNCRASVGVAVFPRDGADVDGLLSRADQAMYVAKRRRQHETADTS